MLALTDGPVGWAAGHDDVVDGINRVDGHSVYARAQFRESLMP